MDDLRDNEQLRAWIEARMLTKGDDVKPSSPDELIESIGEAEALLRLVRTAWPQENCDSDRGSSEESDDLSDSPKFGRFQVKRLLGDGGMGTVFLARDPILERDVALKVPHPGMDLVGKARMRFLREARAAGIMRHPNIVGIYESGETNGICYTASEFCDGPSLRDWLNQQEKSERSYQVAAKIVCQLASAIAHAHDKGVIHRDLKPSNIMLEPSPLAGRDPTHMAESTSRQEECPFVPRITDFGLAHFSGTTSTEALTKSGALVGSAEYMSPEQAAGTGGIGPATDIHALGIILYEMLTGIRPFWRETLEATVVAVQRVIPKSFRSHGLEIPADLEAICFKCLEKDPANRYPSAMKLHDDLQAFFAAGPNVSRGTSSVEKTKRWSRRGPMIVGLVASCLCGVIMAIGGLAMLDGATPGIAFKNRTIGYEEFLQLAYQAWRSDEIDAMELLTDLTPKDGPADLTRDSYYVLRKMGRSAGNRLFLGHQGPVRDIAKVPETDTFVSVSDDGTIRQWNIISGEQVRLVGRPDLVDEPSKELNAVAVSPDGNWLVTGNKTVELWNLETAELVKLLTRHSSPVESLAFSADGELVASASRHNDIRITSLSNGLLGRLPGGSHVGTLNENVSFSQDGKSLYSMFRSEQTQVVRCWSSETFEKTKDFFAPVGQYEIFALDPTTRSLAATSGGRFVHLRQLDNDRRSATTDNFEQRIRALSFSPKGNTLACIGDDGKLHYWRTTLLAMKSSGSDLFGDADYSIAAHSGVGCDLEFLDEDRILTCGEDGSIKLWDLAANDKWNRFDPSNSPSGIQVSHDGELIAISFGTAGYVLLYDRVSGEVSKIEIGKTCVWHMNFGQDDKWLAISDDSEIVILVDCESKKILRPDTNTQERSQFMIQTAVIAPPTDLNVISASSEQITLSWQAPTDGEISSYELWWYSANEEWQKEVIDKNLTDSMTHTLSVTNSNALYTFVVHAASGAVKSEAAQLRFLLGTRDY